MHTPDASGVTAYASAKDHERQMQRQDPDYKEPTIAAMKTVPAGGQWYWFLFTELHATRSVGAFGANQISLHDMKVWMELNNETLSRSDREILMKIDRAYLDAVADFKQRNKG